MFLVDKLSMNSMIKYCLSWHINIYKWKDNWRINKVKENIFLRKGRNLKKQWKERPREMGVKMVSVVEEVGRL